MPLPESCGGGRGRCRILLSAVVAMDSNGYLQLNTFPLSIYNHRKACLTYIVYIPASGLVITPMNMTLIQMTGSALKVSLIMRNGN